MSLESNYRCNLRKIGDAELNFSTTKPILNKASVFKEA